MGKKRGVGKTLRDAHSKEKELLPPGVCASRSPRGKTPLQVDMRGTHWIILLDKGI
jgi:hypothetical protein